MYYVVIITFCDWIVTELFGIDAVRSVLQQVAQNPQLMTNMLQAPYVQAMLQSMSSNPSLVLQVSHNNLFLYKYYTGES